MSDFIQQIIADTFSQALKSPASNLSGSPQSIQPEQLHYLLQLLAFGYSQSNTALSFSSDKTHSLLIQLISSEIYDHIEGGFFTLTVISETQINDYSKSLSSNAYLITLLTKSSGHFFEGLFSVPAIDSAQWTIQNLQSDTGAFYQGTKSTSASDKYYKIDTDTIKQTLDKDSFTAFCSAYNLTDISHLSSTNKIRRINTYHQIADQTLLHIKQVPLALETARQQLILDRQSNDAPELCYNICCYDNCNMISTLFIAAQQFNRDNFSQSALRALKDIQLNHWNTSDKNISDYLSMLHALLMRLQFQWDDDDYSRLLQIGDHLIECSTEHIIQAIANDSSDSTVDDFYNLFFLSSNNQFLTIATTLITESLNWLEETPSFKAHVISGLMKSSILQNFVVIRGTAYESLFWQQQLNSGYKPYNHVYAIPNNSTGPDSVKFPITTKTQGIVYQFNEQIQDIHSQSQSLDELLNHYSNAQIIDKKKTP